MGSSSPEPSIKRPRTRMIAQKIERRSVASVACRGRMAEAARNACRACGADGDGVETRAVGGAVRNTLLGLPVTEIDLATTAEPESVVALAAQAGFKAVPTGIDHGTVTVDRRGQAFRGDDAAPRCRDVRPACQGRLHDLLGGGRQAARLHAQCALCRSRRQCIRPDRRLWGSAGRRVRFIGEAEARIKEDYLRILRFFRFHAYYGKGPMDAEGLHAAVRAARRPRATFGGAGRRGAAAHSCRPGRSWRRRGVSSIMGS